MNTTALYKPAARWSVMVALAAALTMEFAVVGLASLRREKDIPVVTGTALPAPIEARFVEETVEPFLPENVPPPLPSPPPDLTQNFALTESVPPRKTPHQTRPASSSPAAHFAATPATFSSSRARLTSAPPPAYPYEARRAHATGSGVFLLRFDPEGEVIDVAVSRSTGSAILDQVSVKTFRGWRCQPEAYAAVYVPVTFTLAGAQL